jgi:hypothetical protein
LPGKEAAGVVTVLVFGSRGVVEGDRLKPEAVPMAAATGESPAGVPFSTRVEAA